MSERSVILAAENVGREATTLLSMLRPWTAHGDAVKHSAAELTLALAFLRNELDRAKVAT